MKLLQSLSVLFAAVGTCTAATYSNPLRTSNGGDPNIVYHEGYYYFMSTNFENLQMTRATTLEGLKEGETKLIWEDDTPERCCNVWAPEMHYVGDAWHIYYAAGHAEDLDLQRAHVLEGGNSPWDAYSYAGQARDDWSIDATVLRFPDQNYLVYSGFEAGVQGGLQSLLIAPLTSPSTTGDARVLSVPTEDWETQGAGVNEGAAALYHGGQTFLSFAASYCWTPNYQLGLLTYQSGDPMDSASWSKSGPVFSSANGNYGTGHNSFFTSPDGSEIWNVYHSTPDPEGNCGPDRWSNAFPVRFDEDGTPDFGEAPAEGDALPGPSGEPAE